MTAGGLGSATGVAVDGKCAGRLGAELANIRVT